MLAGGIWKLEPNGAVNFFTERKCDGTVCVILKT